jgi:hypothetical protein
MYTQFVCVFFCLSKIFNQYIQTGKQEIVETEEIEESFQTTPKPNISNIRNKILRNEAYKKLKKEKRKVK